MYQSISYIIKDSVLGKILVAVSEHGVSAVFIDKDEFLLKSALQEHFPNAVYAPNEQRLITIYNSLMQYLVNPSVDLDFALDLKGTQFQKKVWAELKKIRVGETYTYSEIAHRIQAPLAYRAVATACAKNLISILIPCHRVIGKNGKLSGYRWGIEVKQKLLELEHAQ